MKIAVAEPSVIIRSGLLSVLGRLTTLNIQILEIAEIAQLGSALCRQKPDMLIVNPALLGMFSLQKIKSEAGCLPMKCIALQYSVTDSSTLKAYDQTISIYDTAEQIKEKLLQLHGRTYDLCHSQQTGRTERNQGNHIGLRSVANAYAFIRPGESPVLRLEHFTSQRRNPDNPARNATFPVSGKSSYLFPARVVRRTGLSLAPKKRTEGKHT